MKFLFLPNQYSQQRQREKPVWVYPVKMAMEAEYLRAAGHEVDWMRGRVGVEYDEVVSQPKGIEFLSLPIPDRLWTMAFDKRYQVYGNYKYRPATHMQVADGCWWGRCVFCVEKDKPYVKRPMRDVYKELEACDALGFREVFDDSGTFPDGEWLGEFVKMKRRHFPSMVFGCNMRIGFDSSALYADEFYSLKGAGFRMVLVGVESASQYTLNKINKGVNSNDIIPFFRRLARQGLEPHAAFMFGYPWSTLEDDVRTLELCHFLLRKGYAKTAQASIYTDAGGRGVDRGIARKIYDVWMSPEFWGNKLKDLHSWEDLVYLARQIRKGLVRD